LRGLMRVLFSSSLCIDILNAIKKCVSTADCIEVSWGDNLYLQQGESPSPEGVFSSDLICHLKPPYSCPQAIPPAHHPGPKVHPQSFSGRLSISSTCREPDSGTSGRICVIVDVLQLTPRPNYQQSFGQS